MARNFLLSAWKVIHAKLVKPVDNALDSFSMLMLQWMLGTYNIWDVLRITCNVFVSAASYVASVIRHPSLLWTEAPPVEQSESAATAGEFEETDSEPEADNASQRSCTDQEKDFEELSAEAIAGAQQQQGVAPGGDSLAPSVRHRVQPAARSELQGTGMAEKAS